MYPCRWISNCQLRYSSSIQTEAPEAYTQFRQRVNRWRKEHYRTNLEFRLRNGLRGRLGSALKAQGIYYKGKNKLLGCTAGQLKQYLEQFFLEPDNRWMNWDNQGRIEGVRCWEMDHIYPLSKLDLTDPEVLRRAAHWSNFQPLSAADNKSEGATIPEGFEWNGSRWRWSDDSGRTNYELPAAGAGDDESDEFDESSDDDNDE